MMQHRGNCLCNWDSRFSERRKRQRLGMGTVNCRQGQHAQVALPNKVGCEAMAACLGKVKEIWA